MPGEAPAADLAQPLHGTLLLQKLPAVASALHSELPAQRLAPHMQQPGHLENQLPQLEETRHIQSET